MDSYGLELFLSTPSARRATPAARRAEQPLMNFYPRPPRGGRLDRAAGRVAYLRISIHALREEGDCQTVVFALILHRFLSTPSARRATRDSTCTKSRPLNFYPRPPRGGRPSPWLETAPAWRNFYPRPPRGGRRATAALSPPRCRISIHALREEGDLLCRLFRRKYPISIHALREEGDSAACHRAAASHISIHALREEGDASSSTGGAASNEFLSTPSARRATLDDDALILA